jgi:hypothetical protein
MKRASNDKDINQLVQSLQRNGWVYRTGKKHGRIELPGIGKVTVPCTPSDRRAYQNLASEIRLIERKGAALA